MKDVTVRKFEMLVRVVEFFNTTSIKFNAGSPVPQRMEQLKKAVADIGNLSAIQVTAIADARMFSGRRSVAREALIDAMERIARSAEVLDLTSIETHMNRKFQMTRGVGDSKLLVNAHAFAESAKPFVKDFVKLELAPDFLDDLNAKIQAFEQSRARHAVSRTEHVTATRQIDDAVQRALDLLDQLDPIIANKLDANFVLTQKWKNVRHIERAWVSKSAPAPAPQPSPVAA